MNVLKCTNGHYFDADQFERCPHCGAFAMSAGPKAEGIADNAQKNKNAGGPIGTVQLKYCQGCGALLDPGSKFCTQCGKKVEEEEEDDDIGRTVMLMVPPEPIRAQNPSGPAQSQPAQQTPTVRPMQQQPVQQMPSVYLQQPVQQTPPVRPIQPQSAQQMPSIQPAPQAPAQQIPPVQSASQEPIKQMSPMEQAKPAEQTMQEIQKASPVEPLKTTAEQVHPVSTDKPIVQTPPVEQKSPVQPVPQAPVQQMPPIQSAPKAPAQQIPPVQSAPQAPAQQMPPMQPAPQTPAQQTPPQAPIQQKPPVQQTPPPQQNPVRQAPPQPPVGQAQQANVMPVVGWIVCVKGSLFGKSFSIVKGKNTVGSGSGNSIVLEGAKGVEKASHTWIAFDMNMNFFVLPGMSDAFVNGMLVTKPKYIKYKDIITIGEGEYMLVPLCGKDFDWKTYGNY